MAQPSKARSILVIWVSIGIVALLILALPTVFVVFFGMAPTFVAFIVDRSREKYATFCVSALNFCGVIPYLLDLWAGSHSIAEAVSTMTNPFALVIMYGSAGFGWMLFIVVPPLITSVLSVLAQKKVTLLRAKQRELIEEWGESVARPIAAARPAAAAAATAGQTTAEAAEVDPEDAANDG